MEIVRFEDSLILYWEKEYFLPDDVEYSIYLNDRFIAKTFNTHFTLKNLQAETIYSVKVERLRETLCEEKISTLRKKRKIDISKAPYFAVGDGKTVNTSRIQQAINDCGEDETVYIPEGVFITGSLKLHSDMELFISKKAVLQGTSNPDDYLPKIKSRFEGVERECYKPLLSLGELDHSKGCSWKNVVVRGGGSILGGGYALYEATVKQERECLLESDPTYAERESQMSWKNTVPGRARGRLFQFNNSKNILIEDLTLGNGSAWNLHFIYCENITVCNCKIISDGIPNGDGIDPDSCNKVALFNCDFETGDDAIAVKSGKNPQGNIINRPCVDVQIFNCRGRKGIALGSEMSGGIENVRIWDCEFLCSRTGLRLRSTRKRGGYIKNVKVRNCKFIDLHILANMDMNNDGEDAGMLPIIKDIEVENLELTGMTRKHDGSGFEPIEVLRLRGNVEEKYYLQNIRITKFAFVFNDEKTGEFRYTNAQGDKVIPFGVNHNVFGKFPQLGYSNEYGAVSTTDGFMYDDAVSLAWKNEKELLLFVQIIDKYFGNMSAKFSFRENEVYVVFLKNAEYFLTEYKGSLTGRKSGHDIR